MERGFYLLLALAALASASIPASAIVNSVDASRQRRSLNIAAKIPLIKKIPIAAKAHIAKIPVIGTLFGLHATPEIPHLGTYPIWKVHKYHGISLQPVPYPGERIPSNLPLPPNLPGEAPSIVNVPDPNYAPEDALAPPANEYGPPAQAPYPSAPAPSAPYPPVYNAPLSPRDPRGPVSTVQANSASVASSGGTSSAFANSASASTAFANSASASTAFANSGSASTAFANSGSTGGELDLSILQTLLPPELFSKVQLYASTPGGQEKVSAILGIANNARKLKFNAAHSIQGMFQKIFGGAGGSTDVALNSGTWRNIPEVYPATQGIFNSFRAVGTGISGSLIPALPEVPPLPEIPGLQTLPPAPQLPYINLPDIRPLSTNGVGGSYVSIQLPQAPQLKEAYSPPSAAYAPAQQYGPPAQTYSAPAQTYGPPAQTYGPPAQGYDPPVQQYSPPAQQYSVPEIPSTSYGTPVGPVYSYPQSSGSASSSFFQAPQQTYGTPDASFAASENQEQYEGRNGEAQEEAESSESQPQVPLKTTKLHRVQDSRPLRGEALRAYLNSQRGFRPSHQDQRKQTDNEIEEGGQD